MAKKRRKPKPKKRDSRDDKLADKLAGMWRLIRHAAKSGTAEALAADTFMATVRSAVRAELSLREIANRRHKK